MRRTPDHHDRGPGPKPQPSPPAAAWIESGRSPVRLLPVGQIMSAAALLRAPSSPDADIDAAMSGNICRCGTYQRIRAAIQRAAAEAYDDYQCRSESAAIRHPDRTRPLRPGHIRCTCRPSPEPGWIQEARDRALAQRLPADQPQGTITVWLTKSEMVARVHTAIPMIVAEELEVDLGSSRSAGYGAPGSGLRAPPAAAI